MYVFKYEVKKNGSKWTRAERKKIPFLQLDSFHLMTPNDDSYYIDLLKERIGEAVDKTMGCASDFTFLQAFIFEHTLENLGVNTLKRLWGHGNLPVQPRNYTLDILSRSVGYRNFDDFKRFYDEHGDQSSDVVLGKSVQSSQLRIGDRVTLRWNPGRICTVEYLGNNSYRVVSSEKTKLKPGHTFQCPFFAVGVPCVVSNLIQEGIAHSLFEIGKQGGLTQVRLLTS